MVAPISKSNNSASKLAALITNKSGMGFNWFNNGILEAIDSSEKDIKKFANLFLYVSIALAIFSIFMLFNYISTSINSKRRSIGVLRALGSNGMDIFKMFFTESVIIALINAVFAVLFALVGCEFVNLYIRNIMNLSVSFALFNFRQVIIISISCIFTALAACVIPIINISKEKPVNLIARSN
jgi:ABC-type antimicrobial peptide transport system permease subunit